MERTKDRRYTPKPTAPINDPTPRSSAPTSPRREYWRNSHKAYPKKNNTATEIRILWAVVTDTIHLQRGAGLSFKPASTPSITPPARSPRRAHETPMDPAP